MERKKGDGWCNGGRYVDEAFGYSGMDLQDTEFIGHSCSSSTWTCRILKFARQANAA